MMRPAVIRMLRAKNGAGRVLRPGDEVTVGRNPDEVSLPFAAGWVHDGSAEVVEYANAPTGSLSTRDIEPQVRAAPKGKAKKSSE